MYETSSSFIFFYIKLFLFYFIFQTPYMPILVYSLYLLVQMIRSRNYVTPPLSNRNILRLLYFIWLVGVGLYFLNLCVQNSIFIWHLYLFTKLMLEDTNKQIKITREKKFVWENSPATVLIMLKIYNDISRYSYIMSSFDVKTIVWNYDK